LRMQSELPLTGSIRCECLNHVIVINERYLRSLRVPGSGLLFALRFSDLHGEL